MSQSLLVLLVATGCSWVDNAEHAERLSLLDADGDGFFDLDRGGTDCNDADAEVNPSAPERCSKPGDDDCDGLADADDDDVVDLTSGWVDRDEDGFGAAGTNPVFTCLVGSGLVGNDGDCNDDDRTVYPGAPEACPGFGPDKDCSDEPRPCSLDADDTIEAVAESGKGLGEVISGHDSLLAAVFDGKVTVWDLRRGTTRLKTDPDPEDGEGGTASWSGSSDDDILIEVGEEGVLVGLPDRGDYGRVARVRLGGEELDIRNYDGGQRQVVGYPIAWLPGLNGNDTPLPGTIHGGNGLVAALVRDGGGWVATPQLAKGSTGLAGATAGSTHYMAVRYWQAGGSIDVYAGATLMAATPRAMVVDGGPGEDLGAEMLLLDVDGSGSMDLVATTVDGLHAWSGPLDGTMTVADAWWTRETGSVPTSLASGDFNGDGLPDLAVGLSEGGAGAGAVHVFTSGGGTAAGLSGDARLTVLGAGSGDRLGASVAFADVDADGIDDLVIGVPGPGALRVVLGARAW